MESFDPLEFLARVVLHIPEPRRHLVRYYGLCLNVSRRKRLRAQGEIDEVDVCPSPSSAGKHEAGPDARAMRRAWAQLIKRIYEVDPLVCPSCGREMKVITQRAVVDKILRHFERREEGRGRGPPTQERFRAAS